MFVNPSMSEMLNVGGSPRPKPNEEGGVATPLEEDIISSSPASPISTNGEVPNHRDVPNNSVTPMPLLPQILFHNQATTPPREILPQGHAHNGPSPRVQKRLELSPLPPQSRIHSHGHAPNGVPRVRTDPGAPPGCAEHSLNILGGHYLLLDHLEGSHLQRCIDVNTKQEYVCKVRT